MKKYEIIDHTADIGLRAKGEDLKQLFINAALGMFNIMADLKNVQNKKTLEINLEAPNIEELFLSWLSELLYHYNSKRIVCREFVIRELEQNKISALAKGQILDAKKHNLKTEIKAVTFHELKVEKIDDIWQGEVIFDV